MAAQVLVYRHAIQSLHQAEAVFPVQYANLNFNEDIVAGTPIQARNLRQARGLVIALRGHIGELPRCPLSCLSLLTHTIAYRSWGR